MSKTFFTADTHFGHANAITLCNRPFATVEKMDAELIERWNSVVGPRDVVWHLGDFTLKGVTDVMNYLPQLNGRINLIWGNHDRPVVRTMIGWYSSQYGTEINLDGWHITLCHYAMKVWNGSHRPSEKSLMLYGHSHGQIPVADRTLDVGVDCWDFYPVTLQQIIDRLAVASYA